MVKCSLFHRFKKEVFKKERQCIVYESKNKLKTRFKKKMAKNQKLKSEFMQWFSDIVFKGRKTRQITENNGIADSEAYKLIAW